MAWMKSLGWKHSSSTECFFELKTQFFLPACASVRKMSAIFKQTECRNRKGVAFINLSFVEYDRDDDIHKFKRDDKSVCFSNGDRSNQDISRWTSNERARNLAHSITFRKIKNSKSSWAKNYGFYF